jgi:hypothetical protein
MATADFHGAVTGASSLFGYAGGALGIAGGLAKGGVTGDASAAVSAAKLYGKLAGDKGVSGLAGEAGNVLGIVGGLQQGGVEGYGGAAINTAELGAKTGAFGAASSTVGEVAGVAGAALSVYEFAKNWESGNTTSDTLSGAETGASIGAYYGPIGAAIGAIGGAAFGALSSVVGPGKTDPETADWNKYLPFATKNPAIAKQVQNPYLLVAGLFDERSSTLPMYQKYGRMGEQKFTTDMATQINQALKAGKISKNSSADTVYNTVVAPWVGAMGKGWSGVGPEYTNATQGLLKQMTSQYISGQAQGNWKAVGGDSPFKNLPAFGALGAGPNPAQATAQQNIAPLQAAVVNYPGAAPNASPSSGSTNSILAGMLPVILAMPTGANMATNNAWAGGPSGDPSGSSGSDSSGGGSFLSGVSSFLNSPAGNLTEFGTLAGLGEVQAGQQKQENQQQAGTISQLGQPFSQSGQQELSQLQGGPKMGGPMGASIDQQTSTAKNLGDVAQQYSTGQLTPAQNSQVANFVKQQRAMVDSQLAASGNTDGSARDAAYQQIDDHAAQLGQQLTQGNLQISEQAQQSVQQTYSTLLNQALTSSEFGLGAQEQAVQTLIQGDTQLSQSLDSLFAGIAQGFGTAMGGSKTTNNVGGQPVKQSGGGVASSAAGGAAAAIRAAGGVGGTAVQDTSANQENQQLDSLDTNQWLQQQSTNTDISTQNDQSLYTPNIDSSLTDFSGDPFGLGGGP